MKNKHLVLFLIASLGAFLGLRRCDFLPKKAPSGPLLAIDSSRAHRFSVQFLGDESRERSWQRVGSGWRMTAEGRTFSIQKGAPIAFFELFQRAEIQRIASKSRADWPLFSLADSTAARLEFFEKSGRSLGFVWLGGSAKNGKGEAVSFARAASGDEVFEVAGEPAKWLAQHPKSFRINELCRFERSKAVALTFSDEGEKPATFWRGDDGKWADALTQNAAPDGQIERLFAALEKAKQALEPLDEFDEMKKSGAFSCQLTVACERANESFSLYGWRPRGERDFAVRSTQQPDAFFRMPDSTARAIFTRPSGPAPAFPAGKKFSTKPPPGG